jgi:hypothetical protein
MTISSTLRALVLTLVVALATPALFGQATGSLSGTVTDKAGAVVPNAKVTASSQGTGAVRESITDGSGHYLIPSLAVSTYTIQAQAPSFQPGAQKDIRLQTDEHREVNLTLNPASVSTTVEVSASEVAVETSNPTLGQVITSEQVAQLPLNGRNFVQLATLTPGTTQETSKGSFFNGGPSSEVSARGSFSLSVGGSRASSTDWLLDGVDNNELTGGGLGVVPSIDAINEFKVLSYNYSPEWGTRAGPTVLITTKSGSNQLHGSLFEFFRNKALNSKSYFAASKEKFNLNQFGGSLGGALQKDKTFFFLDYQATRRRQGIPNSGIVPSNAMHPDPITGNADFTLNGLGQANNQITNPYTGKPLSCVSPGVPEPVNPADGSQSGGAACNIIPAALINPIGAALVSLYPGANTTPSTNDPVNYSTVPVRKLNEASLDVRLDRNLSSKDSVFARFSYDQAVSFVPGGSPGFAEANAFASSQTITNHGRNAAISETHVFSDHNVNQFTFGFNRIFNHIKSFGDRSCEAAKIGGGIPGANLNSSCPGAPAGLSQSKSDCVSCGLTSISPSGGYWALGDRGFAPFQGGSNVFHVSDSFDMIRGSHNIRVGGGFRDQQLNVLTNAFQDGFLLLFGVYGDPIADLLLGFPGGGIHDQTFKGATTGRRWKLFRPFVQDDWRVNKDLTVNLGLAWAVVTPITEAHNRYANFNFATGKYLIPGVNSDGRVGVELDKTAYEPRIGIAWKPFGSEKTAIRAGYAIFHDSSWNQGGQGLWENPPFFAESDAFPLNGYDPTNLAGPCPKFGAPGCGISGGFQVFPSAPDPATFTGTIQSQNLNFKQGKVQQWNLNVETQLPGNIVLTTGYAGSRSSHILVDGLNLNVGSPLGCFPTIPDPKNPGKTIPNPDYPTYRIGCLPGGTGTSAPYGPFTNVANNNDVGRAHYDSLQVKAETKSARNGIYALVGYTWSKTTDTGFPDGLGTSAGPLYYPLPGYRKADWALSQINLGHSFTASVLYDLPFGKGKKFGANWSGPLNTALGGWEVDVIERATTGFPVFITNSNNQSTVNLQNNGSSQNRPNQICSAAASHPTIGKWFNTQCFVPATVNELGNANRTPVSGPGFVNTDFSAIKHFALPYRDGMGLDFRAEVFNLFNHTQLALPNSDINGGSFGGIISTVNNPRLIQFALKLKF